MPDGTKPQLTPEPEAEPTIEIPVKVFTDAVNILGQLSWAQVAPVMGALMEASRVHDAKVKKNA